MFEIENQENLKKFDWRGGIFVFYKVIMRKSRVIYVLYVFD